MDEYIIFLEVYHFNPSKNQIPY